jgi:transposase
MEVAMNNIYLNLRKIKSPEFARMFIREILEKNKGNVSKTSKELNISRHTVRRARDGDLYDYSKAPKNPKKKHHNQIKEIIVFEAKNTGFGPRRLSNYLREKYSLFLSENTIKQILIKSNLKRKKVRTKNKNRRPLYDYELLLPFTEIQVDTKHILDEKSLPKEVYDHIRNKKLPKYAFNAIDAKTRIRFMMYSYSLNSTLGHLFLFLVILWLRLNNVQNKIRIRVDNGNEFFGMSEKKLKKFNDFASVFNAEVYTIPPGAKHLQGII